jgi:hypothetical protein
MIPTTFVASSTTDLSPSVVAEVVVLVLADSVLVLVVVAGVGAGVDAGVGAGVGAGDGDGVGAGVGEDVGADVGACLMKQRLPLLSVSPSDVVTTPLKYPDWKTQPEGDASMLS